MSLLDIASLLRRQIVAVALVLLAALVAAMALLLAKPPYNETATINFRTQADPFVWASGLIATGDLMARVMMSPEAEGLVRQAGGSADYQVSLVNLYNLEYPNYSVPYATVAVTGSNPVDVRNTFTAVMRVLADQLRARQAGQGIPAADQVGIYVISSTPSVVALSGSALRMLAALAVLTVIAVYLVASYLDRHPGRLGALGGPGRWPVALRDIALPRSAG